MEDGARFCVMCGTPLQYTGQTPSYDPQQDVPAGYPQQNMQPGYPQNVPAGYPQQNMQPGYPQNVPAGYPRQSVQGTYPQQNVPAGYPQTYGPQGAAAQVIPPANAAPDTPAPKKRSKAPLIIGIAAGLLVLAAVIFAVTRLAGGSGGTGKSKQALYGAPELPDLLRWESEVQTEDGRHTTAKVINSFGSVYTVSDYTYDDSWNRLSEKDGFAMSGENGRFAIQEEENGEVRIYSNGNTWQTLEAPVSYFFLSGDGNTLIYGTTDENTWKWDLIAGKKEELDDGSAAYSVSYDGSTVFYGRTYQRGNGEKKYIGDMGHMVVSSEDGKVFLYREYFTRTTNGVSQKIYNFGIHEGEGKDEIIFSAPDPDYDIMLIAYTPDCSEILFSYQKDVYYFSLPDAKKSGSYSARRVAGSGSGYLVGLRNVKNVTELSATWDSTVMRWLESDEEGIYYPTEERYNVPQRSILGSAYLQLSSRSGYHSAEIVRITEDLQITELVPYVNGNVCISDDGARLWAVADGRLAFVNLAETTPYVRWCQTENVQSYYPSGNGIWTPLCPVQDGNFVYYIGTDSMLYKCSALMPETAEAVTGGVFWVKAAADDTVYLLKTDLSAFLENYCGDCYLLSNDEAVFQYGNVMDILPTKNDVFLIVLAQDENGYFDYENADLYRKEGTTYRILDGGIDPYYAEGIFRGEEIDS